MTIFTVLHAILPAIWAQAALVQPVAISIHGIFDRIFIDLYAVSRRDFQGFFPGVSLYMEQFDILAELLMATQSVAKFM